MNPGPDRQEVALFCALAWQKGYMAGTDGNISLKLGPDRILVTPRGRLKTRIRAEDLVEVNRRGEPLGKGAPSREVLLHLAVYDKVPEANAVVHAHPPLVTGLSLTGRTLELASLPEMQVALGSVPVAPYAVPNSHALADSVRPFLPAHRAMLLSHHGTLCLGSSLEEAWALTEKLEHAARALLAAKSFGGAVPLPDKEQEKLRLLGVQYGLLPGRAEPPPLAERVLIQTLPQSDEKLLEKRGQDSRGEVHLIVGDTPLRRVGFYTISPGSGFRGGHLHREKTEGLYILRGRARLEAFCPASDERASWELGPGHKVSIARGVAHRIFALEETELVEFADLPWQEADDVKTEFP